MGLTSFIANFFTKESAPPAGSPFDRQGVGGTTEIGGYLNSAERNAKLANASSRQKVYDEISLNTAIVATGLRYFSSLISGVNWTFQPAKDVKKKGENGGEDTWTSSDKAKNYADWIETSTTRMEQPWYKVVRRTGQFKWIGMSIQECIAQRMEEVAPGMIGIGSIENRPTTTIDKWFLEEQSNKVLGWQQRDPNTGAEHLLDRARCIYAVDDTLTDQPDGVGLLRHVVELCEQLKRLEQLEGWAFETDLRGVPIGRAPTAILDQMVATNRLTRAQADSKLEGIQSFITNHIRNPALGLLLDSSSYTGQDNVRTPSAMRMWDLELAKGNGTGLAEIHVAIERKLHEIARALGIEQFMLGSSSKGSLALSEDKTRNLHELINATVSEISHTLQRDFVDRIVALNKWDPKLTPKLTPDAVALRSVAVIVESLSKLALAGATLDRNDPVINQIRSMLRLVDQPFVTEDMKVETKAPNSGGTPGEKLPAKPTPTKED